MNQCGDCEHFRKFEQEARGECSFMPPTIFQNGYQYRPKVRVKEIACGQFSQAQELVMKEKVRPVTHGEAVQEARRGRKRR